MLKKLKLCLAPSDAARQAELSTQYQKLKRSPLSQNLATWLQNWERVYAEGDELKIPDVSENRAVLDFLNAIENIALSFHAGWSNTIECADLLGKKDKIPSLYDIIAYFRYNCHLTSVHKSQSATFATMFQGEGTSNSQSSLNINENKQKSKKKPCLYSKEHRFKDCPYLIESLRPKDWKLDPSIQT